jgi:oligopeptide/dipeptide ABC transporter ATP-binding protein
VTDLLLQVRDLSVSFDTPDGEIKAVRRVSFDLDKGETLAVVGESGSGKSVTALSIVQLLPYPLARHPSGSIRFHGQELINAKESILRHVRGNRIAMIFQEPMTSLNPLHTVEKQVSEVLFVHKALGRTAAHMRTLELLRLVGLPNAEQRLSAYPHQLSGGERQRVMIAMALANEPDILIADEPTTALDVTIQAQILALLAQLKAAHGMSVLFITNNLGVVAQIADRVAVMYAGEIVELADVDALFARPTHPYTQALLRAMPRVDLDIDAFQGIPGQAPTLSTMPSGCAFAARCPHRQARCEHEHPDLLPVPGGARDHVARCPVALTQLRTKGETSR